MTTDPVRVLYIAGVGRSGSTVLDTVLGSHPDIESVGELLNLPRAGWLAGEYCACGRRGHECPFWSEVRDRWLADPAVTNVESYTRIQAAYEHSRQWPGFLRGKQNSPRFRSYLAQTAALYRIIRDLSGKSIIVDSSKNAVRAFALSLDPNIDLRAIHLVRDGRGVAWSQKKAFKKNERAGIQTDQAPHSVLRTAAAWIVINIQASWLSRQLGPGRAVKIRYEDFMTEPGAALDAIGTVIETDLSELGRAISEGESFPVGHTIAGNRLRMAGAVRLRADTEWTEGLTQRDRVLFWSAAGWLMRRYGYQR